MGQYLTRRPEEEAEGLIIVVDVGKGRRKREDQLVDIRKRKGEESLLKRHGQCLQNQQQYVAALYPSVVDKTTAMIPSKGEQVLTELEILGDVGRPPSGSSALALAVETPSIGQDTHLVQHQQHGKFVEDTTKTLSM
ncbi:hypothetical protein LIER_09350 [Lithospermum erythrorhizon]|uniref:IBB domain-containing protein n=1 Tax=Lithospermum erythrorhizon TaxID=34254 RepID=A0AAV3PHA7_LITER